LVLAGLVGVAAIGSLRTRHKPHVAGGGHLKCIRELDHGHGLTGEKRAGALLVGRHGHVVRPREVAGQIGVILQA
jgi:hypothetical protein